ncbi:hypothetical protein GGQ84_001466 [Desulfitispora alkaliphila]|uniref:hypothetical protein n=1 Tax=Desulfitispora alkaliphila TaxID=622674 RepID=UPI003D24EB96
MNCPVCDSRATGKVGSNQYYCWDCYYEFYKRGDKVKVFQVDEDGTLLDINDDNLSTTSMEKGGI